MVRGPSNEQGETQGTPTARPAGPLSSDDYAQLELARKRGKKVLKAAKVASFDAWTMAIIGGSALAYGAIDHVSAVIGGAIMIVAMVEFKGAAKFRKMDLGAPMLCGLNQLFLLASIAVYCGWNLLQNQPSVMQSIGDPMGDAVLGDLASKESLIMKAFYGLVLIGSVLMQGLTAVYFFTRARHMRRYVRETPAWIIELQKRTG